MSIKIRKATIEDAGALVEFNEAMAEETEGKRLGTDTLAAGVRSVFEDPSRGFYVVAEAAGGPIGGLLVTFEWSDWNNASYWWIQSVYVRPEYRKRGVYASLHRHVEDAARSDGRVCGIRLYVDRDNRRAQKVYHRLGMKLARYDFYESDPQKSSSEGSDG
jgi:GNAT superfamily N-acetyltransferase